MQTLYILLYASAEEIILACKNNTVQIVHSTLDGSEVEQFNNALAQHTLARNSGKEVTLAFKRASNWEDVQFVQASNTLVAYEQELAHLFN